MPEHEWTRDRVLAVADVSRETAASLEWYVGELTRWNRRINLVAPRSLPQVWHRHIADSAQLWSLRRPVTRLWRDLGSGGGFPALVLAILARETDPDLHFELVESDRRKVAFLAHVARVLNLNVAVLAERAESLARPPAGCLSARALAPLAALLHHVVALRTPDGQALFLKGRDHQKELDDALAVWDFEYRIIPSVTDPAAAVIEIGACHGRR
jgi:16S rRNA (guanine527-N7)-methyltransferase